MDKRIFLLIGLLFATSFAVVSCSETDGVEDPYANWDERNQEYIDSIARVARANMGDEPGQWKVIHSYKFTPSMTELNVNDYVYCKVLESGTGASPLYTDTVKVHYRGKLIPLFNGETIVFDQSYTGKLNLETASPVKYEVSGVIVGWTSALQHMREGDRWEVYVPCDLGYGEPGNTSIPGNSTLIFDVKLAEVIPLTGKE